MAVQFVVVPASAPFGSNVTLTVQPGSSFGTTGRVRLRTSGDPADLPVVGPWTAATLVVTLPTSAAPGPYTIEVEAETTLLGRTATDRGSASIAIAASKGPDLGKGDGKGGLPSVLIPDLFTSQLSGNVLGSFGPLGPIVDVLNDTLGGVVEPPPTAATVPSGKYRAVVSQIVCHRETWDHALEWDGKRDEVYVFAAGGTITLTPTGLGDVSITDTTSPVHGDVNNQSGRVQAGSASDRGGIRTGDRVDVAITLWEDELSATRVAVVVPTLWEWDGNPAHIRLSWQTIAASQAQGLANALVNSVGAGLPSVTSPLSTPLASVNVTDVLRDTAPSATGPVGAALPEPMVDSELPGMFGLDRNRPIGYQRSGDRDVFHPKAIVLTAAVADALVRTDLGHGPGVVPIRYTDREDLKGDYTMLVRIERV